MSETNTAALQQKLSQLQDEVGRMSAAAKKRCRNSAILVLIILVVMAGYLFFAYDYIAKTMDEPTIVAMVERQFNGYFDVSSSDLAAKIKAQAPELINSAATAALDAPKNLSNWGMDQIKDKIEGQKSKIEDDLAGTIKATLDLSKVKFDEAGADDPKKFEEALKAMTDDLNTTVNKSIDSVYAGYKEHADDLISYLDKLSNPEHIVKGPGAWTQRDDINYRLVTVTLAALKRFDEDDAQNVPEHSAQTAPATRP